MAGRRRETPIDTNRFQDMGRAYRMSSALPVLNDRLRAGGSFRDRTGRRYALLPMRLISLDPGRYVLTNLVGEYVVLPKQTVRELVHHELDMASHAYEELESRHFVLGGDSDVALDHRNHRTGFGR